MAYDGSMINNRNNYGVKDAINTYRHNGGKTYTQWTDEGGATLEEAKNKIAECIKENPSFTFKAIKQPEGFYRKYKQEVETKIAGIDFGEALNSLSKLAIK